MAKKSSPEPITDEFLITKKFRTSEAFSIHIETSAQVLRLTCLERLLMYCEEEEIDTESVAVLLTQSLKDKIESEANALHLLKTPRSGHLPL